MMAFELLTSRKASEPVKPTFKDNDNCKIGQKIGSADFSEYILKKRDSPGRQENTETADQLNTAKANFKKQVGRVKFFWRGTNFNYPFTFMKMYNQRGYEESRSSLYSEGGEEWVCCVEDLSKKKINPTEFLYR